MKIAVASGKGGTGKTTVATSLAQSLAGDGRVCYLDCDVEAPNGHLFLRPELKQHSKAVILIPHIDEQLCTACGRCVEVCQFHALAQIGKKILVFPQLCHGCGSCTWNCPEGAISEVPNPIGVLETGLTEKGIPFWQGLLTISEPMATPIIRQLKIAAQPSAEMITILDAPPGASCSVVETLRSANYAVLVTEPTPFGLHDLKQMVGIVQDMGIPAGVVINRQNGAFAQLEDYCTEKGLPVLMRIPFERTIAAGIASGKTLVEIYPRYRESFLNMMKQVELALKTQPSLQAEAGD